MKVFVETKEIADEGLESLLGQDVELFCGVYIYAGKLVGVNKNLRQTGESSYCL